MLTELNITVYGLFFFACLIIAIKSSKGKPTLAEYFLARGQFNWVIVGFVAFATNSSITVFINIGEWAYREGMIAFNFELTGILCCVILSFLFSKIYHRNKIYTTAEYMEKRFGGILPYITSFLLIFMYIVSRISVVLFSAGVFLNYFWGIDIYTSSIILCGFCGVYSVIGGQRTILMNGILLGVFILVGTGLLNFFIWAEYSALPQPNFPSEYFQLLRDWKNSNFNWVHVLIGGPIIGIWYHCVNQELVQKFMASKDEWHFQAGALFHGYLKLLVFIMVICPALMAYQLLGTSTEKYSVFPLLIDTYVPELVKSFVLVGFIASALIGLSASFNACATLFTFDFYRKMYPKANDFVLMNIGKLATILIVIVSMVWMVLLKSIPGNLINFVSSVLTYFTPPFAVVFLAGITWKKCTSQAATITLLIGLALGVSKFIIAFTHTIAPFSQPWLRSIGSFNFFEFCIASFALCAVLIIVISLIWKEEKITSIDHLVFQWPSKEIVLSRKNSIFQKRIHFFSLLLLIIVAAIYITFA
ncbi:MAG: sodium/solute symporter [Cytophagaceae bacterium]|jgi:SSS family solute:Na+ symporter|nr:sodium/solute symporter [Cytophagaceae bacterium]